MGKKKTYEVRDGMQSIIALDHEGLRVRTLTDTGKPVEVFLPGLDYGALRAWMANNPPVPVAQMGTCRWEHCQTERPLDEMSVRSDGKAYCRGKCSDDAARQDLQIRQAAYRRR